MTIKKNFMKNGVLLLGISLGIFVVIFLVDSQEQELLKVAPASFPAESQEGQDCKIIRPEYADQSITTRILEVEKTYSMFPCIDPATVKAVKVAGGYPFDDLEIGDVIVWYKERPSKVKYPDGRIGLMYGFVHRVVGFKDGSIVTKGDANTFSDDSNFYMNPEVVTREKYRGLVVGVVNEA